VWVTVGDEGIVGRDGPIRSPRLLTYS